MQFVINYTASPLSEIIRGDRLRGAVVKCQSLAGELSLSCARPTADG